MSETHDLDLAADHVPELCDRLELCDAARRTAERMAERVDFVHPINSTGRVAAAACVYLSALVVNDKRTQDAVTDAADISEAALRDCYQAVAKAEGYSLESETRTETPGRSGLYRRLKRWVSR